MARRTSFTFAQVKPAEAVAAFAFYENTATEHIWPRSLDDIRRYCESGELFGIKSDDTGEFAGLCYVVLDEGEQAWEVGGLIVAEPFRRGGLGMFLLQIALAHTLMFQQPWANNQRIIAHVHEANKKPRGLLTDLKFEHSRQIEIPSDVAPESMARNAEGKLIGDEFEFRKDSLIQLSGWLNEEFDGTLGPDKTLNINLGPAADINIFKLALANLAESV